MTLQYLDRPFIFPPQGARQWSSAWQISQVHTDTSIKEQLDDLDVAFLDCLMQRVSEDLRHPIIRSVLQPHLIDIGTLIEQELDHI